MHPLVKTTVAALSIVVGLQTYGSSLASRDDRAIDPWFASSVKSPILYPYPEFSARSNELFEGVGLQWGPAGSHGSADFLSSSTDGLLPGGLLSTALNVEGQEEPFDPFLADSHKTNVVHAPDAPQAQDLALPKPTVTPQKTTSRGSVRIEHDRPRPGLLRIAFEAPALAPLAHTRFCLKYPGDCRIHKVLFRGGPFALNAKRRAELARVNAEVNRSIKPERANETVAEEKWLISPKAGDCNDYAVTKRHELLARGWPARALLLAEVITTWGEHHLVLVVRSREGDVVADSLNKHISNWTHTHYQWVRIQSPTNPMFWSTLATPEPELAAIAKADREL